jgi:hypothetical protein
MADANASSSAGESMPAGPRTQMLENIKRGDLTLPMIWTGLPIGQLYALCGAIAGLLGVAFALGTWLSDQRAEGKLAQSRFEIQKLQDENETLARAKTISTQRQNFLTQCMYYYQTKDQDHVHASNLFVKFLKDMWKNGNQDMDKYGYQIVKDPNDILNSYVEFKDDDTHYKIPRDIKASLHDALP